MKIAITISAKEISELIQLHLAKNGMRVNIEDIKYSKGSAVVVADAPMVIPADLPDDDAHVTSPPPATSAPVAPIAVPPKLEAIDGGQAPVDMDAILRASAKNAANPGKFPTPERQLMEGESFDFPGGKR